MRLRLLALVGCWLALPGSAGAAVQAGVAAAVRGAVTLDRGAVVGQQVSSGDPIRLGDVLQTGADGGMQVLLLDETVFTLGASSRLVIDEFVYAPDGREGRLGARLVKGAFRFVTGRVADDHPENVELKLPNGTIGIRGTVAEAVVEGDHSRVLLVGPGPTNDASERVGALLVRAGGITRELLTPGFEVVIGADHIPSLPARIESPLPFSSPSPEAERPAQPPTAPTRPAQAVLPAASPDTDPAGSTRAAGIPRAVARLAAVRRAVEAETSTTESEQSGSAPRKLGTANLVPGQKGFDLGLLLEKGQIDPSILLPPAGLPDANTPRSHLAAVASFFPGRFEWRFDDKPFNGGNVAGRFDLNVVIDFGNEVVAMGFGDLVSAAFLTNGSGKPVFDVRSFAGGGSNDAVFFMGGTYDEPGIACGTGCDVDLVTRFLNRNGNVASHADFVLQVQAPGKTGVFQSSETPVLQVIP